MIDDLISISIVMFVLAFSGYILATLKEKINLNNNTVFLDNKTLSSHDLEDLDIKHFMLGNIEIMVGDEVKIILENDNKLVDIGLMEEDSGNLPAGDSLLGPAYGNIAIGQGEISVTPLQVNQLTQLVANNGLKKPLYIAKDIVDNNYVTLKTADIKEEKQVIDPETAKQIRLWMEKVMTAGTGRQAKEMSHITAGKTGSAESAEKGEILYTIISLVKERLPKHYKFDPIKDIQVLTPMKKGNIGTLNLNKELQNCLNPPDVHKKEKGLREKFFRVGDKVMQIKNNYILKWQSLDADAEEQYGEGVFNGDIGYIKHIDTEDEELTVVFDDNRSVVYNFSQLDQLELAYSITIHKSQGSEFPVIVMPVTWAPPMLLTRNILYTAITRAKSLVVLVGTGDYLKQMIDNNKIVERYSGLGTRLKRFSEIMI